MEPGALKQIGRLDLLHRLRMQTKAAHVKLEEGIGFSPLQNPGFGTTLIERSARYELDGEAVLLLRYPETGFVCELRFPALSI